jgi:hypothetical protein
LQRLLLRVENLAFLFALARFAVVAIVSFTLPDALSASKSKIFSFQTAEAYA